MRQWLRRLCSSVGWWFLDRADGMPWRRPPSPAPAVFWYRVSNYQSTPPLKPGA